MENADLKASYQLIAELLLSPDDWDSVKIDSLRRVVGESLPAISDHVVDFLNSPQSGSRDEYVQTLELSPPCPLYLGSHLFDEPSTCAGIGTSARNAYMLELTGLYLHYGLDLNGCELPDYLPVMVDFMSISLDNPTRESKQLRRWFLETHVLPGLDPLSKSLDKYGSPCVLLISALRAAVNEDLERIGDIPAWRPPDKAADGGISLPVLTGHDAPAHQGLPFEPEASL